MLARTEIKAPEKLWPEVRHVLALSIPVALAELGWIAMNVVDTIMIAPLGPVAIGAIAIGGSAFYVFGIFGLGLMLGLDTLVSRAHGAGNREDARHSLAQGVYLALFLTPILMAMFYLLPPLFPGFGIERNVSRQASIFLRTLSWSTLPLLLYGCLRRYLQATGHARPVMVVLITANLINWFSNWIVIQGRFGFPALGVQGSALSTTLARLYMAALLAVCIWYFERKRGPAHQPFLRSLDTRRLWTLLRIGTPAATQIFFEVGAFGAAAFLAGRLSANALAAHQIAINIASVSYMIPLGISSAAAVTVGHASGLGAPLLARWHGFIAIAIAATYAIGAALVFGLLPYQLLRLYTSDGAILQTGKRLLLIAAIFQLFDGVQAVTTGALRGLGNTRVAMLTNLGGYWLLGLPAGWALCFVYGQGVEGIWYGLTFALVLISLLQLFYWQRLSRPVSALKVPSPRR